MVCVERLRAELIEVFRLRGYSKTSAALMAERVIQKSSVV